MKRLTVCLLAAAAGLGSVLASDIPPPRPVDIAAIVRQLGSEEFADREAASRRLAALDVDEPPAELLAALKSDSPEVRERDAKAVKALREHIALNREKAAVRHLPRGERFAKLGRIDLYVASTAAASEWKADDDRLWLPAFEAGHRAVKKADTKGSRMPNCATACNDFASYRTGSPGLRFIRTDGPYTRPGNAVWIYQDAIQAAGVTEPQSLNALVVSRGPVRGARISQSLILATGDVASGDDLTNAVVVCDGDVRVGGNVSTSVIVARGSIAIKGTTAKNTLVAGGTVTIAKPRGPVGAEDEQYYRDVVEEAAAKPLGYVTFFELSAVGVEAKADGKEVRVAAVADGGAFAKGGVKVGDVVADVGGKKPDSPEALRRLLRDALALGDAKVSLLRDGKPVTVTVSLPE